MLTHVDEGRLSLARFVDLTSARPATRVRHRQQRPHRARLRCAISRIVDLKARRTIRIEDQATRAGWTPFDGFEAKGWPMATIIRGMVVMSDGELVTPSAGAPMRFLEALPPA